MSMNKVHVMLYNIFVDSMTPLMLKYKKFNCSLVISYDGNQCGMQRDLIDAICPRCDFMLINQVQIDSGTACG